MSVTVDFLELLYCFNRDDVRYQIVDRLPRMEDVYDRRCVYIILTFSSDAGLVNFTPYTCVSGEWCQVDTADIRDFLGKVDGYE